MRFQRYAGYAAEALLKLRCELPHQALGHDPELGLVDQHGLACYHIIGILVIPYDININIITPYDMDRYDALRVSYNGATSHGWMPCPICEMLGESPSPKSGTPLNKKKT